MRKDLNGKIIVGLNYDNYSNEWFYIFYITIAYSIESSFIPSKTYNTLQLAQNAVDQMLIEHEFKLLSENEYNKLLIMI